MKTKLASAIYLGTIRHRRFTPKRRDFRHSVCYFYFDLAEIPLLFRFPLLFSRSRFSLFSFQRRAYLGPTDVSLDEAVRARVEKELGFRPTGPIRVLSQIGALGFAFNPVSFYYCFDDAGKDLVAIVSEITNTPWDERHAYVLRPDAGARLEFDFPKVFHVSPFLDMNYRYLWKFSRPGETLSVQMENLPTGASDGKEVTFDATLTLRRSEFRLPAVLGALARFPLMALKTLLLIYAHAGILWLRKVPFVPHPEKSL